MPVIHSASSEAKNRQDLAMSSGLPKRPSGKVDSTRRRASSGLLNELKKGSVRTDSIWPGMIAFTRIRSGAYSTARLRVSASSPPFAAEYGKEFLLLR